MFEEALKTIGELRPRLQNRFWLENGGIEAFFRREVLPYTPDAWLIEADTKIGYEVSFTRHFYQPPKLRTLAEISQDIEGLERKTKGLLTEITKGAVHA